MSKGLSTLLDTAWSKLAEGVTDPTAPARQLALATAATTGGGAVRMIVLRGVDRDAGRLTFHTHSASTKVADLMENPLAEALLWDPEDRLQVRLSLRVEISQATNKLWNGLGGRTRLNYARDPLPGAPIDTPQSAKPTPDPSLCTVLDAHVDTIDILSLASTPHRRARYLRADNFTGLWIAP